MYGEIPCNREVASSWPFALIEASTCISHFIATNFRVWCNASLHAFARGCIACNCHLLASNIECTKPRTICHELVTWLYWSCSLGKFPSQQWSCLSDNSLVSSLGTRLEWQLRYKSKFAAYQAMIVFYGNHRRFTRLFHAKKLTFA